MHRASDEYVRMTAPSQRAAYGTHSRVRRDAKEQSRRSLIEATCNLVLSLGVQDVTVDKIVAHAGLSRPTFYAHFQSRDEVFTSLRHEMVTKLDDLYDRLAVIDEASLGQLVDWVLDFLANCRVDRKIILALMQVGAVPGLTFDSPTYYDTVISRLSGRFARFDAANGDPAAHAEAMLLLMQLEGLIRYVAVREEDAEDLHFAQSVSHNILTFLNAGNTT